MEAETHLDIRGPIETLEAALAKANLAQPSVLDQQTLQQLRYVLSFAKLTLAMKQQPAWRVPPLILLSAPYELAAAAAALLCWLLRCCGGTASPRGADGRQFEQARVATVVGVGTVGVIAALMPMLMPMPMPTLPLPLLARSWLPTMALPTSHSPLSTDC